MSESAQASFEDSNIALLGSKLEHDERTESAKTEKAWQGAGKNVGIQIWRIEDFKVVGWPKERYGEFYEGDSYIILHTYKKDPKADTLAYNLYFWLGSATSQDEAGTAAYKTVELDEYLKYMPIQSREVEGEESSSFISLFPQFSTLKGGAKSGFHHVRAGETSDGIASRKRLLKIVANRGKLIIREVPITSKSLNSGDVFVLDYGGVSEHDGGRVSWDLWQWNGEKSSGIEKSQAGMWARNLVDARTRGEVKVFDQSSGSCGSFYSALGDYEGHVAPPSTSTAITDARTSSSSNPTLLRVNRASPLPSSVPATFLPEPTASRSVLDASSEFVLDTLVPSQPIYIWIGSNVPIPEKKMAVLTAQEYLGSIEAGGGSMSKRRAIKRVVEGQETNEFWKALGEA